MPVVAIYLRVEVISSIVMASERARIIGTVVAYVIGWVIVQVMTWAVDEFSVLELTTYDILWVGFSSALLAIIVFLALQIRRRKERAIRLYRMIDHIEGTNAALRQKVKDLSSKKTYDWRVFSETAFTLTKEDSSFILRFEFFDDEVRICPKCSEGSVEIRILKVFRYPYLSDSLDLKWKIPAVETIVYPFFAKKGEWVLRFDLPEKVERARVELTVDKLVPISK